MDDFKPIPDLVDAASPLASIGAEAGTLYRIDRIEIEAKSTDYDLSSPLIGTVIDADVFYWVTLRYPDGNEYQVRLQ